MQPAYGHQEEGDGVLLEPVEPFVSAGQLVPGHGVVEVFLGDEVVGQALPAERVAHGLEQRHQVLAQVLLRPRRGALLHQPVKLVPVDGKRETYINSCYLMAE